jgi:hypothetical protein
MRHLIILLFILLVGSCYGQRSIENGMSGKNTREAINENFDTLYNQKIAYVNVKDYGAVGDGVTDDRAAIVSAIEDAFDNNKRLFFPFATYYISSEISITHTGAGEKNLEIDGGGATLTTDETAGSPILMQISGNINPYHPVTQSIIQNRNWLVCPELADSLSPGDLIKIYSNAKFNDTLFNYNEESGKGEMKVVRNVVDSFVYVSSPFYDSYSLDPWYDARDTAQNWKTPTVSVAKVNPIQLNVRNLNLKHLTTEYEGYHVSGMTVRYLKDSYVQMNIENFSDYGLNAWHSYNSTYNVNIYNTPRGSWLEGGGAPGYGFQLLGTSMNNLIKGNIETARHCFAYNATEGVGWGNTVSINGSSGRGNPIIDSHSPNGSIYIKDCNLYGGNLVDLETSLTTDDPESVNDNTGRGIELGARYCYIQDCNFYNLTGASIAFRLKSEVHKLIVQNCTGINCGLFLEMRVYGEDGSSVRSISVDGLSGSYNTLMSGATETIYVGDNLRLNNINVTIASSMLYDEDITDLFISNSIFKGNGSTSSFVFRHIDNIHFQNVTWDKWPSEVIEFLDVNNVYIDGCTFDSTSTEVVIFGDSDGSVNTFPDVDTLCNTFSIINSVFVNQVGSIAKGIVGLPDYHKINDFHFSNNIVCFHYHILKGTEGGADRVYFGPNQIPDYAVQEFNYTLKNYGNGIYRDVLAGDGSPEGSVTARIGSMYLREDGGANTTLYIKESGTGNTGWAAK